MRNDQVFAYYNEIGLMFKSESVINDNNVEMASLQNVIDHYIETGYPIENENEYVTTLDGKFYFENGDYNKLNS